MTAGPPRGAGVKAGPHFLWGSTLLVRPGAGCTLPTLLLWNECPLGSWGPRQPLGIFAEMDAYRGSLICAFIVFL